ncbi:MAG: glycosyltransferase family 39 protein, partial [Verrucomicrobiota bacterium]
METPPPEPNTTVAQLIYRKLLDRRWEWLVFAVLSALVLVFIVRGFPLAWAINLHAYTGYYFCLVLMGLLAFTAWPVVRSLDPGRFVRQRWRGLLCVLAASVFVHLFQPHIMRVFNDEPGHQIVAKVMHLERENSVPEVGYALKGGIEYGERSLNYRMYFYPFLVSVLHDLTGFRMSNGLVLNGLIGAALFLFVYLGGNRIYSEGGGVLAVLLLLGLPLLDETVPSYGHDITNLTWLAGFFLVLSLYAERRSPARLNLLVVTGLCVGYSRNESALYLLLAALVFGLFLVRDRKVNLTRIVALSPVFMLPILSARSIFKEVMVDLPATFPHLTDDSFFALEYIPANLIRVGQWMFDFSTTIPSSPVLVFLGVAGLLALLTSILLKIFAGKPIVRNDWVLLLFALGVIGAFTFITLSLFWNPVAGEAVRFLLPIHLLFVYAGVWLFANTKEPKRMFPLAITGMALVLFFVSIPTKMREVRGDNLSFAKYADWGINWVKQNDNRNTLYVSQLHTLFLLNDYPAMDLNRAGAHIEDVMQLLAEGYYSEVIVFIIEQYDAPTDSWAPSRPALPLAANVRTEVVDERRWAYNQRARFLRVTGYN